MKKAFSLLLTCLLTTSCGSDVIEQRSYLPTLARTKSLTQEITDNINSFSYQATRIGLSYSDQDKYIYSPLNHYMALSLLTAVSERQELLTALNHQSFASLQNTISNLILSTYTNDSKKFFLNNALCIVNNNKYNQERAELIRDHFNSAVFVGESDLVTNDLNDWIEDVTNSDLSYRINQPLNSGVSLASATYYKDSWPSNYEYVDDMFFGKTTKSIRYLENEQTIGYKYVDGYQVGVVNLSDSQAVFILPDDIASFDLNSINSDIFNSLELRTTTVRIPKMDFSSQEKNYDYINTQLGIKKMNEYSADKIVKGSQFSKQEGLSRIIIDKSGITAVSVIVNLAISTAPNYHDASGFILNKPFYFLLKNQDIITFAGFYK